MPLKHGLSRTRAYQAWYTMVERCTNPQHHAYKDYGGRGIWVDPDWLIFENFYRDMGECPKSLSLERIKNYLGYYKENCKWDTWKNQNNNRRSSMRVLFDGKETTVALLADLHGLTRATVYSRIRLGMDPVLAATKPAHKYTRTKARNDSL